MKKANAKKFKEKVVDVLATVQKWITIRWRSASPGFRYALIYFLCVVGIAGLVWWQFSPADSLVFDPDKRDGPPDDLAELNPGETEPSGSDSDVQPYVSLAAFEQGAERLTLPLQGPILLGCGKAFSSAFHTVTAGIHIGGVRGDPVLAAFLGRVTLVIKPDQYQAGEVWIDHGDFETRYINLGYIEVKQGDIVSASQRLGELGAKLHGNYTDDYLIFEVRDSQQEPVDPLRYVGSEH